MRIETKDDEVIETMDDEVIKAAMNCFQKNHLNDAAYILKRMYEDPSISKTLRNCLNVHVSNCFGYTYRISQYYGSICRKYILEIHFAGLLSNKA